jgi:hypothetical protein
MLKTLAPFFLITALCGCQTNKMSPADISLLEKAVDVSMHEYMSCMERAALEVSNTLSTATEAAVVAHSQCSVEFNRTELLFRESLLAQISWRNTQMAYDTTTRVMTRLKTEMMSMVTEIVVKKRSFNDQAPKSKAKEQPKL